MAVSHNFFNSGRNGNISQWRLHSEDKALLLTLSGDGFNFITNLDSIMANIGEVDTRTVWREIGNRVTAV
jgi:hypothetical protein